MLRYGILGFAIIQLISCDFILPTYRPPPQSKTPKIYRVRRETVPQEPLWIYQGDDIDRAPSSADHPFLPQYIDDIKLDPNTRYTRSADRSEPLWIFKGDNILKAPTTADHPFLPKYIDNIKLDTNTRYARGVDSPSARRGGATGTRSNSGRGDTGPTHPGYNRRNARSADREEPLWIYKGDDEPKAPSTVEHPSLPKYIDDMKLNNHQRYARSIEPVDTLKLIRPRPSPFNPDWPGRRFPLYAGSSRVARDIQIAGVTDKKPTHRDVIIPNWNPNARTKPWQTIGVRRN